MEIALRTCLFFYRRKKLANDFSPKKKAIEDLLLKTENYFNEKYDYIIYSRFDQMYISYHLHGYDQNILIPEGEDYFGIGDRHILIPSALAKDYFGILKFFLKIILSSNI